MKTQDSTITNLKHGMWGTPTWKTWDSMKQRILNPNCKDYPNYGGRGLTIDPRWLEFNLFLNDMGIKPKNKSIGRIDNFKGYWPDNCRWETIYEQNNNRRSSVFITSNGITKTIAQWARYLGCPRQTIRYRLMAGWTPENITQIKPIIGGYSK